MKAAGSVAGSRRGEVGVLGGKPVKVVLCQQYSQAGNCERGDGCQFAHGLMELHQYRAKQVGRVVVRIRQVVLMFHILYRFLTSRQPCASHGALQGSVHMVTPACMHMGGES